jgi:hypothetical protein
MTTIWMYAPEDFLAPTSRRNWQQSRPDTPGRLQVRLEAPGAVLCAADGYRPADDLQIEQSVAALD